MSAALNFPGGSVAMPKPSAAALAASAISWIAVAQDARQRAQMHREHDFGTAAEAAEQCVSYALTRVEKTLAELRELLAQ